MHDVIVHIAWTKLTYVHLDGVCERHIHNGLLNDSDVEQFKQQLNSQDKFRIEQEQDNT